MRGNMILTIGMIVKNEAENLAKCLDSLEPIRKEIESELIIVDTGSEDNTVEIAKRYTENVRHFEWCNDFAAARNASIERAKGKWFMFIDADEWFGDSSEIISFFKSGEYKKYNTATYIQRNYATSDMNKNYMEAIVFRLTRIYPHTKFINPVHEKLNTLGEPVKYLSSFVHHFGYVELQNVGECNKRTRNIELLWKKLNNANGNDIITYIELFNMYFKYDNQKAVEICKKGIEVNKRNGEDKYFKYIFLKFITLAWYDENKLNLAAEAAAEYFSERKRDNSIEDVIMSDIDMYALKIAVLSDTGSIDDIIDSYEKYRKLYEEYKEGQHHTADIITSSPRFLYKPEFLNITLVVIDRLIISEKHAKAAELREYIDYSELLECFGYSNVGIKVKQDLAIAAAIDNYAIISELFFCLKKDLKCLEILEQCITKIIFSPKTNSEAIFRLLNSNDIQSTASDYFRKCISLFYRYYSNQKINVTDIISILSGKEILPIQCADIIYIAFKNNSAVFEVMRKIDTERLSEYYSQIELKDDFIRMVISFIENIAPDGLSVQDSAWLSRFTGFILKREEILEVYTVVSLFKKYSYFSKTYMEIVFNPEMLNDAMIIYLPKETQIGYYCFKSITAFDSNERKACIFYLKKAVLLDISLKKITSAMGKVSAGVNKPARTDDVAVKEFEILGKQVKESIRLLISQGNNIEASKLLSEYIKINPGDNEIEALMNAVKPCPSV